MRDAYPLLGTIAELSWCSPRHTFAHHLYDMSENQRPYTRHRGTLDYNELRREAHALVQESEMTQQEVADELDISRGVVGKAVTLTGPRYERTQKRILQLLSDYVVQREEEVQFRLFRKDKVEE